MLQVPSSQELNSIHTIINNLNATNATTIIGKKQLIDKSPKSESR